MRLINKIKAGIIIPVLLISLSINAQSRFTSLPEDNYSFIIVSDLGRNGSYDQQPIAAVMGEIAENNDIEFIVASGDIHHYLGVQSVDDPLWMTNYELIYSHPELQIPWYPILGNHEYRGNTQAVIDYTNISRRWEMPSRYYSQSHKLDNGKSLLLVYIDTPPLIDKYRNESDEYPDAVKQDMQQQLSWIESVLSQSNDTWKIVIGHHPIYAQTSKDDIERQNLQERVDPILKKYNVDMYICGHIHNFQHINVPGSDIDYIVNSSASLSRKVSPTVGTVFCSPETGFCIATTDGNEIKILLINKEKEILHTVTRRE